MHFPAADVCLQSFLYMNGIALWFSWSGRPCVNRRRSVHESMMVLPSASPLCFLRCHGSRVYILKRKNNCWLLHNKSNIKSKQIIHSKQINPLISTSLSKTTTFQHFHHSSGNKDENCKKQLKWVARVLPAVAILCPAPTLTKCDQRATHTLPVVHIQDLEIPVAWTQQNCYEQNHLLKLAKNGTKLWANTKTIWWTNMIKSHQQNHTKPKPRWQPKPRVERRAAKSCFKIEKQILDGVVVTHFFLTGGRSSPMFCFIVALHLWLVDMIPTALPQAHGLARPICLQQKVWVSDQFGTSKIDRAPLLGRICAGSTSKFHTGLCQSCWKANDNINSLIIPQAVVLSQYMARKKAAITIK